MRWVALIGCVLALGVAWAQGPQMSRGDLRVESPRTALDTTFPGNNNIDLTSATFTISYAGKSITLTGAQMFHAFNTWRNMPAAGAAQDGCTVGQKGCPYLTP